MVTMATKKTQYGDPRFLFFQCIQNFLDIHCVIFYQISISSFKDMKCDRIFLKASIHVFVNCIFLNSYHDIKKHRGDPSICLPSLYLECLKY